MPHPTTITGGRRAWSVPRLIRYSWVLLLLGLVACHQDMYNQPRYDTYEPSTFFADGRSARPPVAGTLAQDGFSTQPGFFDGTVGDAFVSEMPFPLTEEVLVFGQERYNAYCMPCHGLLGDGDGIIEQRGYPNVPTLHNQRLREVEIGYFVNVITNGFGRMYSYAARIPPEDRWAIAAYVRALQLSQNAPVTDVPPAEQQQLREQ